MPTVWQAWSNAVLAGQVGSRVHCRWYGLQWNLPHPWGMCSRTASVSAGAVGYMHPLPSTAMLS